MGKAAVDLPDPLQASADADKPRSLTSTDDLLAQLAGEEIDRLLAEVEEAAPPAAPAPIPDTTPAPAAPATFLFDDAAPAAASPAPPVVPPVIEDPAAEPDLARDAADLNAELDAIFGAAAPSPPAVAGVADQPRAAAPAAVQDEERSETSAAERAGLNASALLAPAAVASSPATTVAPVPPRAPAPEADASPLPLYLRPLEWINAPLESCPQAVRDFVGKAAIITLANAAAILIYVLLFRRG